MLPGGKRTDGGPMYRRVPQKPQAEAMVELEANRAVVYRQFQVKVGNDWCCDIDRAQAATDRIQPDENVCADRAADGPWKRLCRLFAPSATPAQ